MKSPGKDVVESVERAIGLAAHRGPDGRGLIFGNGLRTLEPPDRNQADWVLGHARLSIIDLSRAGAQPMAARSGRLWITYNGEVYNYVEIRSELMANGRSFVSETDTEVVLAAYDVWGESCVDRFIGMFAFVIVDLDRHCVFAARDRLGIKPLYLWRGSDRAALVSEPKQLGAFEGFSFTAEREQLADFLVDGFLGHDPDRCCLKGVRPMRPATRLTWPLGELPDFDRAQIYWQPSRKTQLIRLGEAIEGVGFLASEATRLRLRSDVPIGCCLSGGIDSSTITGLATRRYGYALATFSSCFDGFEFDEQIYIDAVNRHCRKTMPVKVYPSQQDAIDQLDKLIYHQDEPIFGLNQYAHWRVTQAARQASVPVLLNGQGGDEALCGYRKYAFFYLQQLIRGGRPLAAMRHSMNCIRAGDSRLFDLRAGSRYLPKWLRARIDPVNDLLKPEWRGLETATWSRRTLRARSLAEFQWDDLTRWSLPVLLRYEDRNSMAHSIETRVPFVDHRFIEFCLTLPPEYFFIGGMTKRMMVMAMADELPDEVRYRRTKMGFDTPQAVWMRDELGRWLERRVLECKPMQRLVDADKVAKAFFDFRLKRGLFTERALFRLASAAIWIDQFQVAT